MGEEREHRVTARVARAPAQEQRRIDAIEGEFGRMNVLDAAAHMKHSDNPRLVDSLRRQGLLLAYRRRGDDRWWYPPFQYSENGGLLSVIPKLLEVAAAERVDPVDLTFSLCTPNAALEGAPRPVDLLRSQPDKVIEAARRDLREHTS